MKESDLTPAQMAILATLADHGELLLDAVMRASERRDARGKSWTQEVRKNDWTVNQARLNGLLNSMKSVLAAREHARKKVEPIAREVKRLDGDVIMLREHLNEFYVDMKAAGRVVSMLEDVRVNE